MAGAHEQKLMQALHGASSEDVAARGDEWSQCAGLLRRVAQRLATADLPIPDGDAGAETARAMNSAFKKSAEAMGKRADQLRNGQTALTDSATAIETAKTEYAKLGAEGSAPTYTPHEDPGSEAGIKAHNKYLTQVADFQAQQQHREEVARQQNAQMDAAFTKAQTTMKEIHGQQPPSEPPPGRSGGSTGGGHTSTASGGHPVAGGTYAGPADGGPRHQQPGFEVVPGHDTVDYVPGGDGDISTPGSPGVVPIGGDASVGGSTGGLGVGGAAGIGAGGAAAGLLGAKLTGALKGGGLFGSGASATAASGAAGRGTAASAVRGIGASTRAGTAGTLGRGSGTAAGSSTAGRSGAAGRGGAGAAGRSGAGATGRSGAGGRAGGRGAGATGRSGRSKDEKKTGKRDPFEVGEDWVGDDEAAPGVLD